MSNKIKSLSYIKTAEAVDKNTQQQPELLQKDVRNVELDNNNGITELQRKIDTITRYQKPYISKMLNKLLLENKCRHRRYNCRRNTINSYCRVEYYHLKYLIICFLKNLISILIWVNQLNSLKNCGFSIIFSNIVKLSFGFISHP